MGEPTGVLGEIVRSKQAEVARRFDGVSLDAFRQRAIPTRRSLAAAIAGRGARFILEIKKSSPSLGAVRPAADVAAIARSYAPVADAISVLTDGPFFGGSLGDLRSARSAYDGPILAKDVVVDPRQVVEARLAGADAILVMLSVLSDAGARTMIEEAARLGMDALVEVHDARQMRRAIALGAPLVGINNRDLRDLSIDLSTTERLAPLADGRLLVAESGIGARSDVARLAGIVDGFLVGGSLMAADDPGRAARRLVFGHVKLCGLTRSEDVDAGGAATYAGFVFVRGSPRHVSPTQAAPIAGRARRAGMLPVGIFRDAPVAETAEVATLLNLHAVQLHGREDVEYVQSLRRELPPACEIWTAASVGRDPLVDRGADRMLFDHGSGGSGRSFDWTRIRGHPGLRRALIAGGIGPSNAAAARALGAHAIDLSSSVEALPGLKSRARIEALFDALRAPGRREARQCA